MTTRCRRTDAFTLVELLVTVGIIAVLATLLMATLSGARRQARVLHCLSNLRQMGMAFEVLLGQNKGRVPASARGRGPLLVEPLLLGGLKHVGVQSPVMFCPDADQPPVRVRDPRDVYDHLYPGGPFRPWGIGEWTYTPPDSTPFHGSSYGINGWLGTVLCRGFDGNVKTPYGPQFRTPLKESSRVPLIADAADATGYPAHADPPPLGLSPYVPLTRVEGREAYSMARVFSIPRHGRAINVVFMDGHAANIPLAELWKLKWGPDFEPTDVALPP